MCVCLQEGIPQTGTFFQGTLSPGETESFCLPCEFPKPLVLVAAALTSSASVSF